MVEKNNLIEKFQSVLKNPIMIEGVDQFLSDWRGVFKGKTKFVVFPSTTEEVSKIVILANKFNIQSSNWKFLTGSRDVVWDFAKQLSLNAGFGSEEEGGFFHSPFVVLVDKKGFIRTAIDKQKNIKVVWDATSVSDMKLLSEDLSQLFFNQNKPLKK